MFLLLAYAFLSNFALAVVPHEPVVIWYGERMGIWATAAVATLGTAAACWVDYRLFSSLIARGATRISRVSRPVRFLLDRFSRTPFVVVAVSGLTPLPFFPFKALALATRYPLPQYLGAVSLGRFPRYLLLAWLGAAFQPSAWVLTVLLLLVALPSLRLIPWNRKEG